MPRNRSIPFYWLLAALIPALAAGEDLPDELSFNRDIRPILSDKCFACHGPDAETREADLRLDNFEGATADLGGYAALDPAKPEDSEILFRLETDDKSEIMPPPETDKPLTAREIALLQQWIADGGKYDRHWAFTPITMPELPPSSEASWPRNGIDHFIRAGLDDAKLDPNPEAETRALVRRVTLDLTGLPPTLDELREFEVALRSPEGEERAYERVVDRLLASPRFGEHMARYWLDAVRYGDTHGLHLDNYREFYPFRDWIISSFNENKPWNLFVTEQLAGDLLPEPSQEQLIATGFNRAHVTTSEGGSIKEEVYVRNVKDRIDTFGTLFLGLTVTCAGCHNHKFDPVSQQDYYSLFAYFNSLEANPMDGNKKDHAPVIKVETPAQAERIAKMKQEVEATRAKIHQAVAAYEYVEPAKPKGRKKPEPVEIVWIDDDTPPGAKRSGPWKFEDKNKAPVFSGRKSHTQTAQGNQQHFFNGAKEPLTIGKGDILFAHVWLDPKNPPKEIMLQWNDGSWGHRAYWGGNHIDWGKDKSPSRKPMGKLPEAGKWVRLEVKAAEVGLKPGAKVNGWAFTQFDGHVRWDKSGHIKRFENVTLYDSMQAWVEDQRRAEKPTAPKGILDLIKKEDGELNKAQQARVREYFIENAYDATYEQIKTLRAKIPPLEKQRNDLNASIPTTLVWKEKAKPKPSFMLNRGEYDQKGDEVKRSLPEFLPPLPEGAPNDRLGLARWLLDPQHPLFARVTVNRFWQQVFGTGIVKTAEDFGLQGETPSHPELLDWLAVRYRVMGWDTKALMKLLVTSATYRQGAVVTPEKLEADPENRLYARAPRFRLDAETLRDQALFVSGLLVEKIGGPGVKPPQPDGLWKTVGYSGSNTVKFTADTGPEKVHRRSIYTFWKRTAPPPQMSIADAPPRESCVVRRERTNTPLQALMLMNDPQYFETARHLAERTLAGGGADPKARLAFMFELAVSRPPSNDELAILHGAYFDHAREFSANPERAKQTITVGEFPPPENVDPAELAPWTMIANLVMNLDEFLTK